MADSNSVSEMNQRFQQIWLQTKPRLESGAVDIAGITESKLIDISYIVALIVLEEVQRTNVVPQIVKIQNQLRDIDPGHYYYPPSSLHITVAGCTPHYKAREVITEERIKRILEACNSVIKGWTMPIQLHIKGVNALASGVFLQVFSHNGSFSQFRQRILAALKGIGENPIEQLDTGQIHLNIMKFNHSQQAGLRQLAAAIESMRELDLGEHIVDNVELDFTDKFQSPFTTRKIQRFSLSTSQG